jgi:SH3 domain protein
MRRGVLCLLVLAGAVSILLSPACLHAGSMYVRDWIVITLRSAPNETALAMGTASTNDLVEVLEDGDGWVRIQTKDGKEGWVATRFLSPQPPKTLQLKQLEDKFKALQVENMRLRGMIAGHTSGGAAVAGAGATGMAGPPEVAFADCPSLKADHDRLLRDKQEYTKKINILDAENKKLKTSERLFFTFIGGIFIILGIVIGLLIQMVGARAKKHGYKF